MILACASSFSCDPPRGPLLFRAIGPSSCQVHRVHTLFPFVPFCPYHFFARSHYHSYAGTLFHFENSVRRIRAKFVDWFPCTFPPLYYRYVMRANNIISQLDIRIRYCPIFFSRTSIYIIIPYVNRKILVLFHFQDIDVSQFFVLPLLCMYMNRRMS